MNTDMTYARATKLAASLKAVGQSEIYLNDHSDAPWHLVTSVEPGGSHRMEIATSVWFRAYDDASELSFRWSFDIEPYSANGLGHYEINVPACQKVLAKLTGDAKTAFRDYLGECASKVQAKADEWRKHVTSQDLFAQSLRDLATAGPAAIKKKR